MNKTPLPYRRVKLMHASLNRPFELLLGTISGFHRDSKNIFTNVYTPSGVFPAVETEEQIGLLIDKVTENQEEPKEA